MKKAVSFDVVAIVISSSNTTMLNAVQTNYLWVLCSIGLPGNTMAIIIILTMQSLTAATFLVAFLAFSDGAALLTKLLFLQLHLHVEPTDLYCGLQFVPFFFSHLANWTLVFISVERFISVCYPLKKSYLVTLPRCYICVAVMSAVFFSYHAALYFSAIYAGEKDNKQTCLIREGYITFMTNVFPAIGSSTVMFVPFLLIATFTLIIVTKLKLFAKQRRRTFQGSPNTSSRNSNVNSFNAQILHENERAEKALTWMLVLTALLFLALAFPACVYFMVFTPPDKEVFLTAQYILYDCSHALNFFLYFMAARRFRNRCFELICRGKCSRLTKRKSVNKGNGADEEDERTPDTLLTTDNV
ncbi:hypothetical protein Btru_035107 [Bulinus truncatus]|nr:hypothetical protein Btru_035107 [Bulinus truncatus]